MEKFKKLCFKFLWAGSKDTFEIPWVKWETIAIPKSLGGWGLENMFIFSKSLIAKLRWKIISSENLWTEVVNHKYTRLVSLDDWIRKPVKVSYNYSIIWKSLLKYFLVIGDGLAWRIGKENKVRLGSDPWSGSGHSHLLLDVVKIDL